MVIQGFVVQSCTQASGKKPSSARWNTSKGWRGELLDLRTFTMHLCAQGEREGTLSHFKGIKEWVDQPLGLHNVLMCSKERRAHQCTLKGWRKIFMSSWCSHVLKGGCNFLWWRIVLKRKTWSFRVQFQDWLGFKLQKCALAIGSSKQHWNNRIWW